MSLVTSLNSIAQSSISPSINNDYCPLTNITFTVTLTGTGYSSPNVAGWAENVPANVVAGSVSGITTSGGNDTKYFRGITYTLNQSHLIKQWKYKNDQNRFSLNVANLQKGSYIIVVKKGKFKESKQVLIEK